MNWQTWFKAFGADLLPVIPPDAESDTIAKHLRGKVPGIKKSDGKWCGLSGALVERFLTKDEAMVAHRSGAGIGIQGRNFPGLDIDVGDELLAAQIEEFILRSCGPAPVRLREGSPRRLLMYAGAGLRKVRTAFLSPQMQTDGKPWAVELLATGQYYNVEGTHPSGAPYHWRGEHPTTLGPFGLTELDEDKIRECFQKS